MQVPRRHRSRWQRHALCSRRRHAGVCARRFAQITTALVRSEGNSSPRDSELPESLTSTRVGCSSGFNKRRAAGELWIYNVTRAHAGATEYRTGRGCRGQSGLPTVRVFHFSTTEICIQFPPTIAGRRSSCHQARGAIQSPRRAARRVVVAFALKKTRPSSSRWTMDFRERFWCRHATRGCEPCDSLDVFLPPEVSAA